MILESDKRDNKMNESHIRMGNLKILRPIRNKKHTRKSIGIGQKPMKKLFTPEIKRFLKDWLVRRRDNPYPNRDEKKRLAYETGLTYIQICNWFANWRRKLKNASNERNKKTWAHLIKTYNNTARGNVEQFSITSDDSIWEENETATPDVNDDYKSTPDHSYTSTYQKIDCFHDDDLTKSHIRYYRVDSPSEENGYHPVHSANKYKSHIMEKYLRGLKTEELDDIMMSKISDVNKQPVLLSRWLESAAKFQPKESNYVSWFPANRNKKLSNDNSEIIYDGKATEYDLNDCFNSSKLDESYDKDVDYKNDFDHPYVHGKEEVEAAMALTRLAGLFRS